MQYLYLILRCRYVRFLPAQFLARNTGLRHLHVGIAGIDTDIVYGVISAFGVIAIVVYNYQELMETLHTRAILQGALYIHLIPFAGLNTKIREITSGERVYQFSVRYLATGVFSNTIELE